jgi:hypothetical protein
MAPTGRTVFRFPPGLPGATFLLQFPVRAGDTETA